MSNRKILDEFLDYKEHIGKSSKHTISAYKNDLNQYIDFLSEKIYH